MQKTTAVINQFTAGEVSPKLNARTDLAQYQSSCRTIQNGIVIPQGGVEKRPGTYFVSEVKDSTAKTRLIPFKYSATQQYMLEFGNLYIRFYHDHAQVISSPGVPLEVVTPYVTADLFDLYVVQSADVMYIAHPNYPPAKLSRTSTGWVYSVISFQTGQLPVSKAAAGQAGTVRITVNNHGLASNNTVFISGVLGVPQSNGTWIINVVDVDTFDLIGSSLPGWAINGISNQGGLICLGLNNGPVPWTSGTIVNVGGVNGTIEANGTWETTVFPDRGEANFTLNNSAYVNTWLGGGWVSLASSYNYQSGGGVTLVQAITAIANNGAGQIRVTSDNHGFNTGQAVTINPGPHPPVGGPPSIPDGPWEITVIDENTYDLNGSAFSPYYAPSGYGIPATFATSNTYPSTVVFFEQRLCWGATKNQPQTLWLSVTGDFENLIQGTNDDDAMQYTLDSDGVNEIQWVASWNVLLLGTVDGEWRFGGAAITDPITPSSALAKIQSNKGSANIKAILVGDFVIFVQYYGRKVYQIGYSFVSDSFTSSELTKLASHITWTGFVDMTSQGSPDTIIWFVRNDGQLVSLTFYSDEKICAFARHITQGSFESIARINGSFEDELWVIVNRTINGVTKRFIEYFMPRDFTEGTTLNNQGHPVRPYPYFFVDCGLTFDGGDPQQIVIVSASNPVVVTFSGAPPANGSSVRINGVQGMTFLNGGVFTVANATSTTFQLANIDIAPGTAGQPVLYADGSPVLYADGSPVLYPAGVNGTGGEPGAPVLYADGSPVLYPDGSPVLYSSTGTANGTGGTFIVVTNTVSGMGYLNGETVDICVDGAMTTPEVVTNGGFTLPDYFNYIAAGLHYDYILEPQSLEMNIQTGTSVGITKRIEKVTLRLYNTVGCQVGPDRWKLDDVLAPIDGDLFSGDMEVEFNGDYHMNAFITIMHSNPLPCTVLGIMPIVETYPR